MKPAPSVPLNDFTRWATQDRDLTLERMSDVLKSGLFINGPYVRELEASIGTYLGSRQTIAVGNGSDGLSVALHGLKIGTHDEVATVGNAAGYASNVIFRHGATPILVDIDSATGQMSPENLAVCLDKFPRIRAVIVTNLYGLMADFSLLASLCQHYGKLLIEDCAQSFGAIQQGVPAGAWGDAAAFSFYPTKNLAALGDGGLVAFKNPEACVRARKIAQYGWSSRYEVELSGGINSRFDEVQAAVVLHRLNSISSKNLRRRDILRRYSGSVTAPRRFIFEDSERCVAHLAVMRTPTRDRDRAVLSEYGVETAIHYPIPDNHQPAWRYLFDGVVLPNTEAHCAEVVTLPCFPELTDEEINRVCEALENL